MEIGFILVFTFALLSFVSAAHPDYPDLASPYNTNINSGALSISDTIIYNTGYYSVNGNPRRSFNLQGECNKE